MLSSTTLYIVGVEKIQKCDESSVYKREVRV
jgi:hypothetical protein